MIRNPSWTGKFYPANEADLKSTIQDFLSKANLEITSKPKALISPHAGYIYSGLVAAHVYKLIENYNFKKVVIIGPSHHVATKSLAFSTFTEWETPLGHLETISPRNKNNNLLELNNTAHQKEHSIEVQLPFLQETQPKVKILPLLTGFKTDPQKASEFITTHLDKDTLLIISSDLSHYLQYEEAMERDQKTIDRVTNLKTNIEKNEACGNQGINILNEIARPRDWKPKLLKYLNSGDTTNRKDSVVGYASIAYV
jgi:hypothetical protein